MKLKIISARNTPLRLAMPDGKITIRFRQMRGVWQCFAGRTYISGASGENPDDAAQQLADQYDVPSGSIATIHGFKEPRTLLIPLPSNA